MNGTCSCKSYNATVDNGPTPVWDELFGGLSDADVYSRQMSIHNGALLYNHSQPWITHVSLQGHEGDTPDLREKYGKPVIWDEERYEGNITSSWGALSGEEMSDRFWWGASLGAYVGHSETIMRQAVHNDDLQPLWWAKGGSLVGTSPPRIRWFWQLWGDSNGKRPGFGDLVPTQSFLDDNSDSGLVVNLMSATDGSYMLLHFLRPGRWEVPLHHAAAFEEGKTNSTWELRRLDYWNMQVTTLAEISSDAASAIIDVASIPSNFEIVLVWGCVHDQTNLRGYA